MSGAPTPGLAERLEAAARILDAAGLQRRFDGLPLGSVAGAPPRSPVRVGGEIRSVDVGRRGSVLVLDVVIAEGSAEVVARFTGRRSLSGIEPGRGIVVEGVGRHEAHRLVIVNPAYALAEVDATPAADR